MSTVIETHYVNQYKNTVSLLAQQRRSVMESILPVQPCSGQGSVVADQFGSVVARRKMDRHEDTKYSDTPRARRWLQPVEYYSAELVDKSDIIRLLTDPKSSLAEVHVAAMNRAKDAEFLTNIFAAAATGELPTSGTAAYTTGNDIALNASGLTPAKLIEAHAGLMNRFVDTTAERPYVIIPVKGWQDMFGQSTFTSGDFNNSKPLQDAPRQGIVYGGMELVTLPHVDFPRVSTTEWLCPVFVPSGVVMGVWQDLEVEVQKHPLKVSSYEVKVTARFAVTRTEEAKVGRIRIQQ
jgi:hypothetical protein